MDASRFHNALRILFSIDPIELALWVSDENWGSPYEERDQIAAFLRDPCREALRMPDANFDRLFALIEARQPKAAVKATEEEPV